MLFRKNVWVVIRTILQVFRDKIEDREKFNSESKLSEHSDKKTFYWFKFTFLTLTGKIATVDDSKKEKVPT